MPREIDVKALVSHIVLGNGMDKCRICMGDTTEGQVHLGDTVMTDGERPVTLSELLEIITGVEVDEQCGAPNGICKTCVHDAMVAISFRRLVHDSAGHWDNIASSLTELHNATKEDKAFYVFYTPDCKSTTIIKDQAKSVKNTDEALLRLVEFRDKKPKRVKKMTFDCSCPDCGKKFTKPLLLNKHLKNTLKRICNRCGKLMPKSKLAQHMSKYHDIEVFDCNICHKLFDEENRVTEHYLKCHDNKSIHCDTCKMGFDSARSLNGHTYSHSLFHCKNCSKSFENLKCFSYHQEKCSSAKVVKTHDNIKYTCDYCGLSYDKKPSLRVHIIHKHLNVLPYVCELCGKRTSTIGHLRSHEAIHTQKRKIYECYCGARLRTEVGYQMHQRIHTGEKPYECEECGDKFLSASRRLDHIKRRHRSTQEMPHGCDKCHARFVRPFELKKHYLSVHYACIDVAPAPRAVRRRQHIRVKSSV
ncbi:zinc finger protein 624 isoform X2 [Amyelois transitella]|uniref:zinc finger protein 624 isoform X2 n=1 Tax=Amyelois transitella TaxID=680683 RepID=UPI00067C9CCC|nr:zinc finger protein 624 isoform X2 [Amyelois transitella]